MQPDEYRRMAAVEDSMWYYRALHRHIGRSLARAGLPAAARVLDAGCGTGGLLRRLGAAHPPWHLTGIDVSPLACALARERTPATIVEGSVAALPFGPAQFDAVVSCDVLCQVEDPALVVRELHRCLRPGGTVVLTMPAYGWLFSYHDQAVQSRRRSTCGEVNTWLRPSLRLGGARIGIPCSSRSWSCAGRCCRRRATRAATCAPILRWRRRCSGARWRWSTPGWPRAAGGRSELRC